MIRFSVKKTPGSGKIALFLQRYVVIFNFDRYIIS